MEAECVRNQIETKMLILVYRIILISSMSAQRVMLSSIFSFKYYLPTIDEGSMVINKCRYFYLLAFSVKYYGV